MRADPAHADALVDRFPDARARRNEVAAARQSESHARTPTVTHADSLGRPSATVAHNKASNENTTEEFYTARVVFDIEGNQREVIDAHDRVVVRYQYDMLGTRLHQASMEAGERWMLSDVAGKPLYAWDSRGHRFRSEYDVVQRPTASFVREGDNPEAMVGRAVYGESRVEPEAHNLRGQVVEAFDQAGSVTTERYDFKGNPLWSIRQLADTVDVEGKKRPAYRNRVDWSRDVTLKPEAYISHTRYDALGRPTQVIAPRRDAPEAHVNVFQPTYNEAGLLERLDVWLEQPDVPSALLDPSSIAPSSVGITNIDYDAKGQRQAIKYSNGVSTRYRYDPQTFRLVHMRTEGGHGGRVLQDLHYTFDPAGNITHIRDDAHQEVFFANARVEASARYRYDALFRLTEATGREHLGQAGAHPHSHNDAPRVGRVGIPHASDGEALGRYLERYLYDAVGNIASVRHIGTNPHNPGWTRNYTYAEPSQLEPDKVSNRLTSTTVGRNSAPAVHRYDEHGNMLDMPHLAAMRWNELDQLQMTQRQVVNDTAGTGRHGERTWYVYDGGGQRIRKVTERPDGRIKDERLYLGSFEIYREHRSQGDDLVRETLHVMDDTQRIALVETRISGDEKGIPRRQVRYQLANHLGSATLEVDDQARILSYEEYSPYGSTAYQAVRSQLQTPKRYRFTAMERDDESGLNYHSARYYAPWLGRWVSADPVGLTRGTNLYDYAGADPINRIDPTGTDYRSTRGLEDELRSSLTELHSVRTSQAEADIDTSEIDRSIADLEFELGALGQEADLEQPPPDESYNDDVNISDDVLFAEDPEFAATVEAETNAPGVLDKLRKWWNGHEEGLKERIKHGREGGEALPPGPIDFTPFMADTVQAQLNVGAVLFGSARVPLVAKGGSVAPARFSSKSGRWHNPDGSFRKAPTADELRNWARSEGWTNTRTTPAGFETWSDATGVKRMKIKPASTLDELGPGSKVPRVTIWDASGQRVDGFGRPVTRKSKTAHAPLAK